MQTDQQREVNQVRVLGPLGLQQKMSYSCLQSLGKRGEEKESQRNNDREVLRVRKHVNLQI
jgi:hypothetical protein